MSKLEINALNELVNQNVMATLHDEPLDLNVTDHFLYSVRQRRLRIKGISTLQKELCRVKKGECRAVCVKGLILVGVRSGPSHGTILTAWKASKNQIQKMLNSNCMNLDAIRRVATPIYNILDEPNKIYVTR